jgi:DNA (cytosine-5)-methyltransferase 1
VRVSATPSARIRKAFGVGLGSSRSAAYARFVARTRASYAAPKRGRPSWRRPIAIDVFSGAGGFSLGAEQAGFDVVAAVEYDPIHAAAHAYNFPNCEVLCADASTLDPEQLRQAIRTGLRKHGKGRWDGELDMVVGGVPCQGFSAIGKRHPEDPRNRLAFSFLNVVRAFKPRYFLMENVQGMTSFVDPQGDGEETLLKRLVKDFEDAGYTVLEPQVLNASAYGVPQDRKRLILIGCRKNQPLATYPAATHHAVPKRATDERRPSKSEPDTAAKQDRLPGPTVAEAIDDLPNIDAYDSLLETDTLSLGSRGRKALEAAASAYVRRLRGLDDDPKDFSYRRTWKKSHLSGLMRTLHEQSSIERFDQTKVGHTESVGRFYRLDPKGLSSTLRAGTGYERGSFMAVRPIHPTSPRVICVREAARLHSFPDWFGFHVTKWHGFRQIGNSLPPLLGRAVAAEIVTALRIKPVRPKKVLKLGDPKLLQMATYAAAEHFGAELEMAPTHARRLRKRKTPGTGNSENSTIPAKPLAA